MVVVEPTQRKAGLMVSQQGVEAGLMFAPGEGGAVANGLAPEARRRAVGLVRLGIVHTGSSACRVNFGL